MTVSSLSTDSLDEEQWPGLFTPRSAVFRSAVARRIVRRAVHGLPVRLRFPDGTEWGAGKDGHPVMINPAYELIFPAV